MLDVRLRHLVAVARTGSFTAAARSVGVTQSAVTKSVAEIERQIGYPLFHRTARGAMPTEEGRDFVERAARLLDEANDLFSGSLPRDDPFAGILHVGICPASLEWTLSGPLERFLAQYPSTRVEVSSSSFERMVQLLRNGGVDVALGFDEAFSDWPDIKRLPLGLLEANLFVRKGHPAIGGPARTLAGLTRYDFIASSDSRPYGALFRHIYEGAEKSRKRLHIIDYFPTVRRIVAASDAIGIVARAYAATPAFQSKFEVLECTDLVPPTLICCAYRARWDPKPAARAFLNLLRKYPPEC